MNQNDKSITKHNELIQAGYRLSLNEARIVFYGISLVNPLSETFPLKYQIKIKEFAQLFGLESDKDIYGLIKETVMGKFWEREVTLDLDKRRKTRLRWLTGIEYGDKEGYIKISLNPDLKPFLHQLKGHFTSYSLNEIAPLKSIYAVRFYEISLMHLNKSNRDKTLFIMTVKAIREQLELIEKYKRFSNLKVRVLDQATKEINKHSDISLSYKVRNLGRTPYEIEFSVQRKTSHKRAPGKLDNNTLSPPVTEKAKWLARDANTGWDIEELEQQFWEYAEKKGKPKDIENAFIGFVKKKITAPA